MARLEVLVALNPFDHRLSQSPTPNRRSKAYMGLHVFDHKWQKAKPTTTVESARLPRPAVLLPPSGVTGAW